MTDRGSYCCFFCPKKDYSEKNLNDTCSQCGHSYNYPLVNAPKKIGEYQIVKSLGRGFYATTYIAKSGGRFGRQVVLKVSPVSFFDFFGKHGRILVSPLIQSIPTRNQYCEAGEVDGGFVERTEMTRT